MASNPLDQDRSCADRLKRLGPVLWQAALVRLEVVEDLLQNEKTSKLLPLPADPCHDRYLRRHWKKLQKSEKFQRSSTKNAGKRQVWHQWKLHKLPTLLQLKVEKGWKLRCWKPWDTSLMSHRFPNATFLAGFWRFLLGSEKDRSIFKKNWKKRFKRCSNQSKWSTDLNVQCTDHEHYGIANAPKYSLANIPSSSIRRQKIRWQLLW